ncbi:MAG: C13 family peptidase [Candidatus Eisenbacteria bacterium]
MRGSSVPFRTPHLPILGLASLLLGLFTFVLLPATIASAAPPVDRDDAVSIVTRTQLGGSLDGVRLFVDSEMLPPGETIATWHKDVFTAPAAGWFVFVDLVPGANYEHPCSYFFVESASGTVQRFDAMTPPRSLARLTEITNGRDNPPDGVSEAALERFSERLRSLPKPGGDRGQAWAFLISGGADPGNNHIRYWNDISFIYRTLVDYYGYADDHIRVCMSDGTNPAVDRSNGTNSPVDLDGDGDADTEYPATLQFVGQVFGELAATLTASDQLFIFTTDHGGQESGHDCYLNLWNYEELRDDQMAAYIAALPCQTIICTFEQCFSGGMVDDLTADGRVIATAANWDEYSWAMGPDYTYDTFVYHWTSAVGWETPAGQPVDADTNNDNMVSIHEAFLYAQANDHEQETPQYSSTPEGLGDMLNLFGNLEGVYLAVDHTTVNDDNVGASHGDGDGEIDYGETIELTVALHNMGLTDAVNVWGTLATESPYVTVTASQRLFGSIPSEQTVSNAQPFVFQVANDVPDGEPLLLTLQVTEDPGILPLALAATAPSYRLSVQAIHDQHGDNDGIADPGETMGVIVKIENVGSASSPAMWATLEGEGYITTDGGPHHVGMIPPGLNALASGFEVTVSADCPPVYTAHLDLTLHGYSGAYEVPLDLLFSVGPWLDDVELDWGWTIGAPGDAATSGIWVQADPVGTTYNGSPCQPENDHTTDPGHICFVTGNGSVGGAAGEADVDGGKTTLLSPVFDVSGAASADIRYWRWYTNNLGNSPGLDYWDVDVTADGTNWVHLEHTVESANSWTEQAFDVGSVVPLTGTIQFRFVADDVAPGSLIEAAVDDIQVTIVRPPAAGVAEEEATLPSGLGPFRPNPIRSGSSVSFRLAAAAPSVRLDLYDIGGRRVRTLFDGPAAAGEHTIRFAPLDDAGAKISSGIYFLRLETPDITQVRQVAVIR